MDYQLILTEAFVGLIFIFLRKPISSITAEYWVKGVWKRSYSEKYLKLLEFLYTFFGLFFIIAAILHLVLGKS